jgi:hypothetical protein
MSYATETHWNHSFSVQEQKGVSSPRSRGDLLDRGVGTICWRVEGYRWVFPIVDIGQGLRTLINPEIVEGNGESILEEGRLSLPNVKMSHHCRGY